MDVSETRLRYLCARHGAAPPHFVVCLVNLYRHVLQFYENRGDSVLAEFRRTEKRFSRFCEYYQLHRSEFQSLFTRPH